MQAFTTGRGTPRPSLIPILGRTVIATLLVVGGLALAYIAFATPLLSQAIPAGRPSLGQSAMGMGLWAAALVAPAGFVLVGTNGLARTLASVKDRGPNRSAALRALADLPDGVVAASRLTLPDGRGVSELVVGPFGAAVIRELPPTAVTRVRGGQWELQHVPAVGPAREIPWTGRRETPSGSAAGSGMTTSTSWSRSTRRSSETDPGIAARPRARSSRPTSSGPGSRRCRRSAA